VTPPRAVFSPRHTHAEPVIAGDSAVIRYAIENQGDAALEVTGIHSKWECVRIVRDRVTVPAHASGTIDLAYASTHELGQQEIPLSFSTNDPKSPQANVVVAVTVLSALAVEPAVVDVGALAGPEKATVTVVNRSERPVRLLYALPREPWLVVEVPREPVPPGGKREVTLSVTTRPAMAGAVRASAQIAHDLGDVGPLIVGVRGRVEPEPH